MTWIINEFDDYGGRLEATEVFVLVTRKGAAGLVFKRPPDPRERYIHGEELQHFGVTAEYVLESVEEPGKKRKGGSTCLRNLRDRSYTTLNRLTRFLSRGSRDTCMKAIGYTSVSTDEQAADGVSLYAQRAKIEAYCVAKDWQLASVEIDQDLAQRHESLWRAGDLRCRESGRH